MLQHHKNPNRDGHYVAIRSALRAQTAKEVAPDEPHISDTLGWILYQRGGVYQRALSLLRESAAKLPGNAEIQYHLGMAAVKVGGTEAARIALARAAKSPEQFVGKDEVKEQLAEKGCAKFFTALRTQVLS